MIWLLIISFHLGESNNIINFNTKEECQIAASIVRSSNLNATAVLCLGKIK